MTLVSLYFLNNLALCFVPSKKSTDLLNDQTAMSGDKVFNLLTISQQQQIVLTFSEVCKYIVDIPPGPFLESHIASHHSIFSF